MQTIADPSTLPAETPAENGRANRIADVVRHAAHWLPAQGPITAFVHHNTLHALEHLPFAEAVVESEKIFGCQPYLGETHYRRFLEHGRIQGQDLASTLMEDLGDRAEELIGCLGTRFHLRMAMLEHPIHALSDSELNWLVAENDELFHFRPGVSERQRQRVISSTRRWVTRDFHGDRFADGQAPLDYQALVDGFDTRLMDKWSDSRWESFTLHLLWKICRGAIERQPLPESPAAELPRHRDWLLARVGIDSDERVHEFLTPFCAAYLDQGFSTLPLPGRDTGFYPCFRDLYSDQDWIRDHWLGRLPRELRRQREAEMGVYASIVDSLEALGVEPAEEDVYITSTLLALRGWAGMLWQAETRGDRVVRPVPPETLAGFLAVRLLLDRLSAEDLWAGNAGYRGPLSEARRAAGKTNARRRPLQPRQRAFQVFQIAQSLGWKPEDLHSMPDGDWAQLLREMDEFPELQRRRIFQLAYERRYRNQALDALVVHGEKHPERLASRTTLIPASALPRFQVVCCIDDREESFRRHLEEVAPDCETFGAAGFFAVAMYYRGVADAHFQPLCPVIMQPRHFVREEVAYPFQLADRLKARTRRVLGRATHQVHVGSRTLAGGVLTALFGSLASIPLVARVLMPRLTSQVRGLVGQIVQPPPITQLLLERLDPQPGPADRQLGFSVEEMSALVERLLRDLGLTTRFARLVVVLGHGSTSLNNPHSAAYDCGACGGGRGGPNSRAFAQMANDYRVREQLRAQGIAIGHETVFLGGFHDTGSDAVTFYDLDRLPVTHRGEFERMRAEIQAARERNAHERCRRFQSADLELSPESALRHVEARSADLSQARPECGHATNAACFVGRRSRTRGLFLDRRVFLTSYDPLQDTEDASILMRLLQAVIPVCSGINLEYYFSYVDPTGWGCGTKLPHNVTSLLGVMDGAASDLRTGLPWQMVEIHEPLRLLFIIETTPEAFESILDRNPPLAQICRGEWIQIACLDPHSSSLQVWHRGRFEPYFPESHQLPSVVDSLSWYRGWRDCLGFAEIEVPPGEQAGAQKPMLVAAPVDSQADEATTAEASPDPLRARRIK